MHEISLVSSVWRTLKEALDPEELEALSKIKLKVGVLSCVEPKLLDSAYRVLVEGTRFRDVELECKIVEAKAECGKCGDKFTVERFRFICPRCQTPSSKVISGEEFLIEGVEFKADFVQF